MIAIIFEVIPAAGRMKEPIGPSVITMCSIFRMQQASRQPRWCISAMAASDKFSKPTGKAKCFSGLCGQRLASKLTDLERMTGQDHPLVC